MTLLHARRYSSLPLVTCKEYKDDMEIDIKEDENEPELTYPYEEVDSYPPRPALLVEKLKNVEEKAECKKLKKELEEARGFVFEERPNEAIDVSIKDEKSPLSEPRGSPPDV
ncbi:hypothetical protein Tco_0865325 [Tanacetum coccineum]